MKKNKLISGILAAAMAFSSVAAVSFAEESENAQIEATIKSDNVIYAINNYDPDVSRDGYEVKVNTDIDKGFSAAMQNYGYSEYTIPNVDCVEKIYYTARFNLQQNRNNGSLMYSVGNYIDNIPADGIYVYKDTSGVLNADETERNIAYNILNRFTELTKANYTDLDDGGWTRPASALAKTICTIKRTYDETNGNALTFTPVNELVFDGTNALKTDVTIDVTTNVLADVQNAADEEGTAKIAFVVGAGDNSRNYLDNANLTVFYNSASIKSAIEAEIAAADTAEKVKAVVENYNTYIGIDTSIIANMDYAYAEVAKTTATANYTLETFKTAVETAAKGYLRTITIDKTNHVSYVSYLYQDFNSRVLINAGGAQPAYNNVLYVDFDNIKYRDYITGAVLEMPGGLAPNKNIVIRYTTNETYMESDNMPEPGTYYWEGTADDPDGANDDDVCYTYFSKIAGILNGGVPDLRRNTTKTGSYQISTSADDYTTYKLTKGNKLGDIPEIINTSLTTTKVDDTTYYSTTNLPLASDSYGYNLENQTSISGSGQMKFDLSKISGVVDNIKNSNGRVAFISRGGGNINFDFSTAKLHLTYDASAMAPAIEAAIAAADTIEEVKAVIEEYNSFIGIDTSLISNMDYAYAEVAKTTATAGYTLEGFKTAVENAAKAYIKTVKYEQDNYVLYNQHDKIYKLGLYVNQQVLINKAKEVSMATQGVTFRNFQYMSSFDVKNLDAVKSIVYKTKWNNMVEAGTGFNFITNVTEAFPIVSTKSGFTTDDEDIKRLNNKTADNPNAIQTQRNTSADNAMASGWDSFDCSSRIADLKTVGGTNNAATLSISLNNGSTTTNLSLRDENKPYLEVTYDMTKVMEGFDADLAAVATGADLKGVVAKYNKFIGADMLSGDDVYDSLVANKDNYTFETLKDAFDEIVEANTITVTYDKPSDYIIFRRSSDGSWNGHTTKAFAMINSPFFTNDADGTYYNFDEKADLDSVYAVMMLGYDIPNSQAVTDVEFTATAALRNASEVITDINKKCRVAWDAPAGAITTATVGAYEDDTEATDDVYDTVKVYYEANKHFDTTVYEISDTVDEKVKTAMNIPETVKDELRETGKLEIIFNSDFNRNIMANTSNHSLKVTYDLTALKEGEKSFDTTGFKLNGINAGDTTKLVNAGARVELTQTKSDIAKDTPISLIVAAYDGNKLVKAVPTTVNAPGYMGKVILSVDGFGEVEYDTLKVMTWNSVENIKPLAALKEISLK